MARTTVYRIEEPPDQRRHRAQAAIDLGSAAFVFEYSGQAAGGARPHADAESCGVIGSRIAQDERPLVAIDLQQVAAAQERVRAHRKASGGPALQSHDAVNGSPRPAALGQTMPSKPRFCPAATRCCRRRARRNCRGLPRRQADGSSRSRRWYGSRTSRYASCMRSAPPTDGARQRATPRAAMPRFPER